MKKPIPNFSFTPLINVKGDEGRSARLSTPSKCGSCPFSITDVEHMEYWSDALDQTRMASETGKGLLKSVAEKDLVILNKFFKNNFSGGVNEKDK